MNATSIVVNVNLYERQIADLKDRIAELEEQLDEEALRRMSLHNIDWEDNNDR